MRTLTRKSQRFQNKADGLYLTTPEIFGGVVYAFVTYVRPMPEYNSPVWSPPLKKR